MKDKFLDIKKQIEKKHLKNGFCNICLPCFLAKKKIKKKESLNNYFADNFVVDNQLLADLEKFLTNFAKQD